MNLPIWAFLLVFPITQDDSQLLAMRTLERWAEIEHTPRTSGLLRGSVRVKVTLEDPGGTEQAGDAVYSWDTSGEPTSELRWSNAGLGQRLEREGWAKRDFDRDFLPQESGPTNAAESPTAVMNNDGVVVDFGSEDPSGLRRMHFDPDGVLTRLEFAVSMGGPEVPYSLQYQYDEVDGRFRRNRVDFSMKAPWGEIRSTSQFHYAEFGEDVLLQRVVETSTFDGEASGTRTFEYHDWEITKRRE